MKVVEKPSAATPASEAWQLLFSFLQSLHSYWHDLAAEFGVSTQQGLALISLEPGRPMAMNQLAKVCKCEQSNLTGLVDRLEARGLVERLPDAHDRRVRLIALTPEGAELRASAFQRMQEPPEAIAALSAEDQRALRDIMRRALAAN